MNDYRYGSALKCYVVNNLEKIEDELKNNREFLSEKQIIEMEAQKEILVEIEAICLDRGRF